MNDRTVFQTKKPNFIIVGAPKTSTTSLYYYLRAHPEIYMSPVKEPQYFAQDLNQNAQQPWNIEKYLVQNPLSFKQHGNFERLENYLELFREAENETALGEASVLYMVSKVASHSIYEFDPKMKIIMILRDPIRRAYSRYLMAVKEGRFDCLDPSVSHFKAIINDLMETGQKYSTEYQQFVDESLYFRQVKRFLDLFPIDQVKIIIFEEMIKDYPMAYKGILEFLGVSDTEFQPDFNKKYFESKIPTSKRVLFTNKVMKKITDSKLNNKFIPEFMRKIWRKFRHSRDKKAYRTEKIPKPTEKDRKELLSFFKDDILKLEKLIDRNLSSWYN